MKKDKNLDELFRDKLLNYEQEPPAYILENVLASVAGARRKRKIVFWRIAGVAAALFLAFIAGWQINTRNGQEVNPGIIVGRQTAPEISADVKPEITPAEKENPSGYMKSKIVNKPGMVNLQLAELAKENQINQNSKNSTKSIAGNSKSEHFTSVGESLMVAKNEESTVLKPMKSLFILINQGTQKVANSLHEQKTKALKDDWAEKTIDQQIMEQNQMALAQNEISKKARWLVGAQVSPEYNVSRSSHSQVYASNMLNASANPVDLGGGISVEYKKGKRWSLQSGVYYSGMGQSSGNTNTSSGKDYLFASADRGSGYFNTNVSIDANTSKMSMNSTAGVIEFKGIPSGIVLGANLEEKALASNATVLSDARFIQNFEYIEIPLYLRYTILDSRFDVEMLGGFSSNVLVGNQTYMESSTGKSLVGSTKDMEPLNYSGTLGVGLKYGLSKRIFLNVEPRVKYFLNSLNSNSSVTYKPYTIGVFTGLSYEF
ncbi:MAG: outer membrane beta-barrel protein [Bacteroidota bacterium]|nr:outer membrane beta-barrel protein [Bacteroidota bacterium]